MHILDTAPVCVCVFPGKHTWHLAVPSVSVAWASHPQTVENTLNNSGGLCICWVFTCVNLTVCAPDKGGVRWSELCVCVCVCTRVWQCGLCGHQTHVCPYLQPSGVNEYWQWIISPDRVTGGLHEPWLTYMFTAHICASSVPVCPGARH